MTDRRAAARLVAEAVRCRNKNRADVEFTQGGTLLPLDAVRGPVYLLKSARPKGLASQNPVLIEAVRSTEAL